jgi:hypothetical protein
VLSVSEDRPEAEQLQRLQLLLLQDLAGLQRGLLAREPEQVLARMIFVALSAVAMLRVFRGEDPEDQGIADVAIEACQEALGR